jgi:hypothetical protein
MPLDREIDPEEFRELTNAGFGAGADPEDQRAWYKRWYVWVFPAAVVFGLLIVGVVSR